MKCELVSYMKIANCRTQTDLFLMFEGSNFNIILWVGPLLSPSIENVFQELLKV